MGTTFAIASILMLGVSFQEYAVSPASFGLDAGFVLGTNGIVSYAKEWLMDVLPENTQEGAKRYMVFFLPFAVAIFLAYTQFQDFGQAVSLGIKYGIWASVVFRGYKVMGEGK